MPIFAYVFPLFTLGTITLCILALVFEGAEFNTTTNGLFGQYGSWHYLWRAFYLGAVPGIMGHVSFNTLLKWINPLVIALAGKMLLLILVLTPSSTMLCAYCISIHFDSPLRKVLLLCCAAPSNFKGISFVSLSALPHCKCLFHCTFWGHSSNAGTTEPLIGVAIGLLVGIGNKPGIYTYVGGTILIAATVRHIFSFISPSMQTLILLLLCKSMSSIQESHLCIT